MNLVVSEYLWWQMVTNCPYPKHTVWLIMRYKIGPNVGSSFLACTKQTPGQSSSIIWGFIDSPRQLIIGIHSSGFNRVLSMMIVDIDVRWISRPSILLSPNQQTSCAFGVVFFSFSADGQELTGFMARFRSSTVIRHPSADRLRSVSSYITLLNRRLVESSLAGRSAASLAISYRN